jgi:predicted CopG family antitoxin
MVTIEIPEKTYKKLEEIRKELNKEGAGIDDVLRMLIERHSKKKRIPPEVVDQAEIT